MKSSELAGELGGLKVTNLGGAEAGRGGRGGESDFSALHVDFRLREGGESRAESNIGVVGGVLTGVVGVAG